MENRTFPSPLCQASVFQANSLEYSIFKISEMEIPRPKKFCAYSKEGEAELWLISFQLYVVFLKWSSENILKAFPLFLENSALTWYLRIENEVKQNVEKLYAEFKRRYCATSIDTQKTLSDFVECQQGENEPMASYITRLEKFCSVMEPEHVNFLLKTVLNLPN